MLVAFAEAGQEAAGTVGSILGGSGAMNGHLANAGNAAIAYNMPVAQAAEFALDALRVNAQHAANMGAQVGNGAAAEGAAMQLLKVVQRVVT